MLSYRRKGVVRQAAKAALDAGTDVQLSEKAAEPAVMMATWCSAGRVSGLAVVSTR